MKVRPRQLESPWYERPDPDRAKGRPRIGLAVESMRRHMTDEGWQIFEGLEGAGYRLYGYGLPNPTTNLADVLRAENPVTVLMQDKREWDVRGHDFREPMARFTRLEALRLRDDVFKLTILKDAQQRPLYHRASAQEINCHAWVVYYHPKNVRAVAPYVREEHLVRTYHTVDCRLVPAFSVKNRNGCLLSGAVSDAYPLRSRLVEAADDLPDTVLLPHPGYHRHGCRTPDYLKTLAGYKVALCDSSRYGYALRKIIEATACGCVVITDLPDYDVLPKIDNNLYRVDPGAGVDQVAEVIDHLTRTYDPDRQEYFAAAALSFYDYRVECSRLAYEVERLRLSYEQ